MDGRRDERAVWLRHGRGALPRELGRGRSGRLLGPADRRDEGAAPRGRRCDATPRAGRSTRARQTPSRRSGGTPGRSPTSSSATTSTRAALGSTLRGRDDFPEAVADALVTIAAADRAGYLLAVEDILESFEQRTDFLEDMPVADTVLVLQALARDRDAAVDLPASPTLP